MDVYADHNRLFTLVQELATYEDEVVVSDDMGGQYCVFCDGSRDYARGKFYHSSDCLIMRAKEAIVGGEM